MEIAKAASKPASGITWWVIGRIVLKTAVLFLLCNLAFAATQPLPALGRLSLYNHLLPGRPRLPYGENPADSYNLSLYNLPAMLQSHLASQPKAEDEFRVFIMGDSSTWGWFLENEDTLAGQLNAGQYQMENGRSMTTYNLGYPVMSLSKDLLLLDAALPYQPDLILWLVTLESFPLDKQLVHPLLQNNPQPMRQLIEQYDLNLNPQDGRFITPTFWQQTIVGQRRNLADLLRLQLVGFSWAATGIDQTIPPEIPLRQSDFAADVSWQNYGEPVTVTADSLAFDVLQAGITMAGDIPILIINEPMFISNGRNSHLRYNSLYPRWVYDQYRDLLAETAESRHWHTLDLWDTIPPDQFTDTPVHLTPAGVKLLAARLIQEIRRLEIGDSTAP